MGLLSMSCVFKNLYLPILLHSFSLVQFLEQFGTISLPLPICHFLFSLTKPRFHKPYPQSKTFLNTQAVSSSALYCSNGVFIATPSSSLHFLIFFDATRCVCYQWNDLNTSNVPSSFDFSV